MPVTAAEQSVRHSAVAKAIFRTIKTNTKNPEGSLRSFPDFFQWLTLMVWGRYN